MEYSPTRASLADEGIGGGAPLDGPVPAFGPVDRIEASNDPGVLLREGIQCVWLPRIAGRLTTSRSQPTDAPVHSPRPGWWLRPPMMPVTRSKDLALSPTQALVPVCQRHGRNESGCCTTAAVDCNGIQPYRVGIAIRPVAELARIGGYECGVPVGD